MSWSLNEIESLAKKATRGAGYTWGIAEEAGKATRWLCAAGWPGAEALAELLGANDGAAYDTLRPADTSTAVWTASGGMLCPLIAGAALCDRAADWAGDATATLGPTAQPLLLVPYLAWAADLSGARLAISWDGVRVTRGGGDTHVETAGPARLAAAHADTVTIKAVNDAPGQPLRRVWRGDIAQNTAATLTALAHRTYAPDTPESRLSGAGAGLSDND